MIGYSRGSLSDEQYEAFMDLIRGKIETLLEDGKKVKVSTVTKFQKLLCSFE